MYLCIFILNIMQVFMYIYLSYNSEYTNMYKQLFII